MNEKDFILIDKGMWKGWVRYPSGTLVKQYGKKGTQNPSIHAKQGYFDAYNENGRRIGTYGLLKEAEQAIGVKKK